MRKLIIAALLGVGLGIEAYAEDGAPKMTISGTFDPVTIEVSSVSKITFDGTKMLIGKADGDIEIDIADVTNIVFDGEFGSEESIKAEFANDFTISFDYGVMTLSVVDGTAADVAIYNVSGMRVAGANGVRGEWTMSLVDFPAGVYIIRVNNKTFKFTR